MKRKNHIKTNTFRTIKKAFPRFISLMIMSLLGVLVFVGLQSTSPDMLNTLDNFLDETNAYDIKIISSLGLTQDDVDTLKNISSVKEAEGIYTKDILLEKEDTEFVLNISSLPQNINTLELLEGRLPEADNEIVVEENFLKKLGYQINDTIQLADDTFINQEATIVGTIRSSLYYSNTAINQNRGTTTIGNGTINYYSYMLSSNFDMSYYTNIYITVKGAKEKITSKKEYQQIIDQTMDEIENIKEACEDDRYQTIVDDALKEIEENEQKANDELTSAKNTLDTAKEKLDTGKKELDSANKQLSNAKSELATAKKKLDAGEKELQDTLTKYGITDIASSLKEVNNNIATIEEKMQIVEKNTNEYEALTKQQNELKTQQVLLMQLQETQTTLDRGLKTYQTQYRQYQSAYQKYQANLKNYTTNLAKYNDGLKEYEEQKQEIENEIAEAKEKINDITHPTWYIQDREDNQTYSSYINQTESMMNLSGVFPLVFYAVAILVSLTSMNRMVEDDRGEIGTLKSLGFTNREIKSKYILFSLAATLIGGIIGSAIGLTAIPYIIFSIYRLLFDVPNFTFGLNLINTLLGILIAIICICGSSIITANRILKEKPAMLMRPKPPKSGKKILLERFTFFWHHIKFSQKITIRNLFRYKKRVFVTIFGICGCTALMLCGFGIKDSIVDITNMQYVHTFKYDATAYTNHLEPENIEKIMSNDNIESYVVSQTITGTIKESNVSMIVTESKEDLEQIINLESATDETIKIETDKVIITDKLASVYKLKIGDTITILGSDKKEYQFPIGGIVKNYLGHYIYLSKDLLEETQEEYEPNVIYLNTKELNDKEKEKFAQDLLENEEIINVIHTSALVESTQDMLNSLDKVVIILVVLSALLSFVVLYNLSNINISERKREIATLKVLGFYNKEVDNYITKENIILTILGIVFGLGFGYLLTNLTISTVEMENAHFIRHIKLNSYIYASLISCLFTLIVNFVTHFTLKKINMIESLKSVE